MLGRWPSKEKLGSKVDNLSWIPGTHMTEGERVHFCKLSPASKPLNLYHATHMSTHTINTYKCNLSCFLNVRKKESQVENIGADSVCQLINIRKSIYVYKNLGFSTQESLGIVARETRMCFTSSRHQCSAAHFFPVFHTQSQDNFFQ